MAPAGRFRGPVEGPTLRPQARHQQSNHDARPGRPEPCGKYRGHAQTAPKTWVIGGRDPDGETQAPGSRVMRIPAIGESRPKNRQIRFRNHPKKAQKNPGIPGKTAKNRQFWANFTKNTRNACHWRLNEICVLTSFVLNAGTSNPTNRQVRPAFSTKAFFGP